MHFFVCIKYVFVSLKSLSVFLSVGQPKRWGAEFQISEKASPQIFPTRNNIQGTTLTYML